MPVDESEFYNACDPTVPLDTSNELHKKYLIDFSPVRQKGLIDEIYTRILKKKDNPIVQLFTGQIGCGKSTELYRLSDLLKRNGYHVVYLNSTLALEIEDIEVTDILLLIAKHVQLSLLEDHTKIESKGLFKRFMDRAKNLLSDSLDTLNREIEAGEIEIPGMGNVSFADNELGFSILGLGKMSAKMKDSRTLRGKLKNFLEPEVREIVDAINKELIEPANEALKCKGKNGLVVIVDGLDKMQDTERFGKVMQNEYLFINKGDYLNSINAHLVYTIPYSLIASANSNQLTQKYGNFPDTLPMIPLFDYDGNVIEKAMELMRQMILSRAMPHESEQGRLNRITEVFDSPETLDSYCLFSGGHARNLLMLLTESIESDQLPLSQNSLKKTTDRWRSEMSRAISQSDWELLKKVRDDKYISSPEEYKSLIRNLYVYEYYYDGERFYDINPVLKPARHLR